MNQELFMNHSPHGPEWENVRHFLKFGDAGEITPFYFKGKEYILLNRSAINGSLKPGEPDCGEIIDVETNQPITRVMHNHYFIEAYTANDRCYCFGAAMTPGKWDAHAIYVTSSDDLVNWTTPELVVKHDFYLYNTAATYNGSEYILLYEHNDPKYPPFTYYFLKSKDLKTWERIPDAIFAKDHYAGGPAIYYMPEDRFYYVCWVREFTNPQTGALNYDTSIARSKDLINWEYGKRPVISPDYSHRPDPVNHPDVYEINASDAEFLETPEGVKAYWGGGNQQGVLDWITGTYKGSLQELFHKFF